MNALEAIKIKKEGGKIERKLSNGLTEVKSFWSNGQICEHYFRNENGKLHGEYKWWRDDGILGAQKNYKNGKWHGEYKWWRDDGTLWHHELYEDDILIKVLLNNNKYL